MQLKVGGSAADGMKAIMVNESDGSYQHMTGFDRKEENHELGGKANIAHRAYWNSILSRFGMSVDDVGTGPGGLHITGKDSEFTQFQKIVEKGTNGVYTVFRDANNKVSLAKMVHTEIEESRLNKKQKKFISLLEDATDESQSLVTIDLVSNSEEVFVGSLFGGRIDIGDIREFGYNIVGANTISAASTLAHELYEQVLGQRYSKGNINSLRDQTALSIHKFAITDAENIVGGYTREIEYTSPGFTRVAKGFWTGPNGVQVENEIKNGTMNIPIKVDGVTKIISIVINNNNIISVKR